MQVLFSEEEFSRLQKAAKRDRRTVAEFVREGLRAYLERKRESSPEEKIAKLLRYAKHAGPTGDIEQILSEIEAGRDSDLY